MTTSDPGRVVRDAIAAAATRPLDDRDLMAGYSGEDPDPEMSEDILRAMAAQIDDDETTGALPDGDDDA